MLFNFTILFCFVFIFYCFFALLGSRPIFLWNPTIGSTRPIYSSPIWTRKGPLRQVSLAHAKSNQHRPTANFSRADLVPAQDPAPVGLSSRVACLLGHLCMGFLSPVSAWCSSLFLGDASILGSMSRSHLSTDCTNYLAMACMPRPRTGSPHASPPISQAIDGSRRHPMLHKALHFRQLAGT